jgi:hypothetical protein
MSWDNTETVKAEEQKPEVQEPEKKEDDPKPAPPPEVQSDPEPKVEEPPKAEPPVEAKLVPQELIGKVAKRIREKAKEESTELRQRLAALEQENARLKSGSSEPTVEGPNQEDEKIAFKVRQEFLRRQDAYGRKKYGDAYNDALELVKAQNDPVLVARIQGAADPADTLISEAMRIAEELELGPDPVAREKKKQDALKSKWRQEWEAEVAGKLSARGNQPTDVSHVRAAGGNETPKPRQESWETSLPR